MKKCGICGKEIKIKFKITEWYDVEPEQYKIRRRYKPERVVKKRYVQKLCWECNQNRGRLLTKTNFEPDEYSEYISLKYDFQNSDLPFFKIGRLKELKKKFENKRLQKEADELENENKLKYTDSDKKDKKEEKKISDVFSDPGFLEF